MQKRTTVYLHPKLHKALKIKAIQMSINVSELINEAIQLFLKEDAIDLEAIDSRKSEPKISFEDVLKNLKKDGLV